MFEELLKDRNNCFEKVNAGFTKRCYVDLFLKEIILLVNSVGKKNYKKFEGVYFVNEVKNSNMSRNLEKSKEAAESALINTLTLEFYQIKRVGGLRIGFFRPIFLMVAILTTYSLSFVLGTICGNNYTISFYLLIWGFKAFLKSFNFGSCNVFLMTDHHFFSSIIAMENDENTYVLQHGLILNKKFYYPIRAGHFCAWGKHSLKLLNYDPKATITGTLKFVDVNKSISKKTEKIIYCISSLNQNAVEKKIDIISEVADLFGYKFLVKCHPGSMYNLDYWTDKYRGSDITFFKDERIEDIDFDVAISENSTINIDLAVMNKPFVIFDEEVGYFEEYMDVLAVCSSKEKLIEILGHLDSIDFETINSRIIKNELNNNLCTLFTVKDYANKRE